MSYNRNPKPPYLRKRSIDYASCSDAENLIGMSAWC